MEFGWRNAEHVGSHAYLVPRLKEILRRRVGNPGGKRLIDIGCGNGSVTALLGSVGFDALGVDPAQDGVRQSKKAHPELQFHIGSVYDDLAVRFGTFDVIVCLEVVEHLYSPHLLPVTMRRLLQPNGIVVLSTPYHGYIKNVAVSIAGKWDFHHDPLLEHGHIKFWSKTTLTNLMAANGFQLDEFYRLGRLPVIAKSMMLVFSLNASMVGTDRLPTRLGPAIASN